MIFRYKIKFISDIEQKIRKLLVNIAVTPFVGVWIEIKLTCNLFDPIIVTPFVGVWIEIGVISIISTLKDVTPFVGVWIEMHLYSNQYQNLWSLPSWECGLKCHRNVLIYHCNSHSLRGSVD